MGTTARLLSSGPGASGCSGLTLTRRPVPGSGQLVDGNTVSTTPVRLSQGHNHHKDGALTSEVGAAPARPQISYRRTTDVHHAQRNGRRRRGQPVSTVR